MRSDGIVQKGQQSGSDGLIIVGYCSCALLSDRFPIFGCELAPKGGLESDERYVVSVVGEVLPLLKFPEWHAEHDGADVVPREPIRLLHPQPVPFDGESVVQAANVERVKCRYHFVEPARPSSSTLSSIAKRRTGL